VSFAEQLPSTDWVTLKHGGEDVAEAWSMTEGEGVTVVFLVPRNRLEDADASRRMTVEMLLEAATISHDQVESWRLGDDSIPELTHPLPAPPPDDDHLTVYARLKPAARAAAGDEDDRQDLPPEKWQALDLLWKTILGLEAGIESVRMSMEGLRAEMEAEFRKSLGVEEKVHALQADVAQWNKAKSRVHYALPKARELVHRATWSLGVPERKRLGELYKGHIEPRVPFPRVNWEREQLEHLQKDRQVLLAQGNAVYQECRAVVSEVQRALGTLQRNAADRARQKRSAGREKGKHF
jgi:hypothetical protein